MAEAGFIKTACQSCEGRLELPMEAVGVPFACPRCGTQLELALKCACEHCGNPLSFPKEYIGQEIECGHCHGNTKLMPSALIADEGLSDNKDSQPNEETQVEALGTSRETQRLPPKKSKKETAQQPTQPSQHDSAVKTPPKRPGQQGRPTSSKPTAETASLQHTNQAEPPKRPNQGGPTPQADSPPQRPNQGGSVADTPPKRPNQGGPTPQADSPPQRPNQGGPVANTPPKRPNQGGPAPQTDSPSQRPNQGGPVVDTPPKRPNQGGPAPQTDSPPQRPNQGGPVAGSPPKRPNQGGAPQGAGAGGVGAMPTIPQPETTAQMEVETVADVQAKHGPSVLKHVLKIIFGFALLGAVTWFVILPLAGIGGSDFLLGSSKDAAPLPMVKPDPESLKVDGLKLEKGDVLTALKGTLKNTGSSTFRNVKITFRMLNKDNAPEEFSHTVNQEISGGASVQFSTSITFEPSDGAAPEVINIDSDEQLAQ